MKQKIYIIGIISFIIVITGTLLKLNHCAGAGILLTLGFFGLVIIFFPFGLINAFRHEENRSLKPLYIVTYVMLFILFTGMLFKIMHWPGAALFLLVALPFPFVVFLPVFLVTTGRIENFSIHKTVTVLLILSFMSVFNALLALNISKERLDDSMFLASLYHRTAQISAGQTDLRPADGDAIIRSADNVLKLIGEAKDKLMFLTFSDSETLAGDPYSIKYIDSRNLPTEIMFRGNEPYLADRLEESIREFIETIGTYGSEKVTPDIARDLLEIRTMQGDNHTWSEFLFDNNWTSWALVYLGIFENNVMLLRDELVKDIQ